MAALSAETPASYPFIEVLFTRAHVQTQPRFPSRSEWIKKLQWSFIQPQNIFRKLDGKGDHNIKQNKTS